MISEIVKTKGIVLDLERDLRRLRRTHVECYISLGIDAYGTKMTRSTIERKEQELLIAQEEHRAAIDRHRAEVVPWYKWLQHHFCGWMNS